MKLLFLTLTLFLLAPLLMNPSLTELRKLYVLSATKKESAAALENMLANTTSNDAPVLICYQGVSAVVQAKYAVNPLNKLKNFNRGKDLIKRATDIDSNNVEIRFLRFTVQRNTPGFLNFNSELSADKVYLIKNTKNLPDQELKDMIISYMSATSALTPEEFNSLKN